MTQTVPPAALESESSAPPDWNSISFPCPCSRCGYELRMLSEPRCPDCGLAFVWAQYFTDLTGGDRRLFEHQWNRTAIRAWFRTALLGLNPWRFWRKRVSIHTPTSRTGLLLGVLISPVLSFVISQTLLMVLWIVLCAYQGDWGLAQTTMTRNRRWSDPILNWRWGIESWVFSTRWVGTIAGPLVLRWWAILLVCFLVIWGLRQTLGRCNVRADQLLRVLSYAAISMFLLDGLARFVELATAMSWTLRRYIPEWFWGVFPDSYVAGFVPIGSVLEICLFIFLLTSIAMGLKHYLRLPHAGWMSLTAGVIALVGITTLKVAFVILRGRA